MAALTPVPSPSRRAWRHLVLLVFTAVWILPAAFGPSFGAWLGMLAPDEVHVCKCGMVPGHCGCPECARLANHRAKHRPAGAHPTIGANCGDDPLAAAARAAPAVLGAAALGLVAPPCVVSGPKLRAAVSFGRDPDAPPTPPPRSRA